MGTFFIRVHANREFKLTLVNDINNDDGELASVKSVLASNNRVEVRLSPRPSATTATRRPLLRLIIASPLPLAHMHMHAHTRTFESACWVRSIGWVPP